MLDVAPSPEAQAALAASRDAAVSNAAVARLAEQWRDRVVDMLPDPEHLAGRVACALREVCGYHGPERRHRLAFVGHDRRRHNLRV